MSSLLEISNHQRAGVQSWIDTSCRAICADPGRIKARLDDSVRKGPTLLQHVLTETYPAMVEAGYELPLNLVVDLTYLFVEGRDAQFNPPKNWPKDVLRLDLAQKYCGFLKRQIEDGRMA